MSFDITPGARPGAHLIQGYGDLAFKIAGKAVDGSVLIFPEAVKSWDGVFDADALIAACGGHPVQILLVGCGKTFTPPPKGLRAALKEAGMVLEWMDTGAACRTFNVLLLDDRDVAAALIAVN